MGRVAGKVALVTGASKGIGAATVRKLAAEGASVVINHRASKTEADRLCKEVTDKGGKAVVIQADVARQEDIRRLITETVKAFGKIDILVNNAGLYEFTSLEEITPEHYHKTFDLNVLGLLLVTQEAVRQFNPAGGSIVNLSSIASTYHGANAAVYCASKAAVDAITRALGTELGPRKIRVNAVNPGLVETEGTHRLRIVEEEGETIRATNPLRRLGQPEDVANAILFLASDESSWITSETLFITGGDR
jgi:3-oxoacyl-[acyl-carrier protein] reductase